MDVAIGLVGLILCFLWVYLCGRVAQRRGRSTKLWMWLGAFLGPAALACI